MRSSPPRVSDGGPDTGTVTKSPASSMENIRPSGRVSEIRPSATVTSTRPIWSISMMMVVPRIPMVPASARIETFSGFVLPISPVTVASTPCSTVRALAPAPVSGLKTNSSSRRRPLCDRPSRVPSVRVMPTEASSPVSTSQSW